MPRAHAKRSPKPGTSWCYRLRPPLPDQGSAGGTGLRPASSPSTAWTTSLVTLPPADCSTRQGIAVFQGWADVAAW